jgi:hypothetical protein
MMGDNMDARISRIEDGFTTLSSHVSRLDNDISEIRATLTHTATKADVASIGSKIDQAINGVLKDAINAVPARQAATWGTVTAMCAFAMLVVTIMLHH